MPFHLLPLLPRRLVPVLGFVVLWGACTPPDRPSGVADPISPALLAHLVADSSRTIRVAEGVWYRYVWSEKGPWGLHLTEVDLDDCAMGFVTLTADLVTERRRSFARVSEMAAASNVLAAVNGDFFLVEGISAGPEVHEGVVRRSRSRPAFSWFPSGGPEIGRTERLQDGSLGFSGLPIGGAAEVVGGLPQLIADGRPVFDTTLTNGFRNGRHPRTAIGISRDRTRLWLVVVDGRQAYSDGMTLPELRELFSLLGAENAINLDGGGSSTMVVGGRLVSHPSDATGERAVVNGLGVFRDQALCSSGVTLEQLRARP